MVRAFDLHNLIQYEAAKVTTSSVDHPCTIPFLIVLFHSLQDNKFRSKLS